MNPSRDQLSVTDSFPKISNQRLSEDIGAPVSWDEVEKI